jgi:hypothetical protein
MNTQTHTPTAKDIYVLSKAAKLAHVLAEGAKQDYYDSTEIKSDNRNEFDTDLVERVMDMYPGEHAEIVCRLISDVAEEYLESGMTFDLSDASDEAIAWMEEQGIDQYDASYQEIEDNEELRELITQKAEEYAELDEAHDYDGEAAEDLHERLLKSIEEVQTALEEARDEWYAKKDSYLRQFTPVAYHKISGKVHPYYEVDGYGFHGQALDDTPEGVDIVELSDFRTLNYPETGEVADIIRKMVDDVISSTTYDKDREYLIEKANFRAEYFFERRLAAMERAKDRYHVSIYGYDAE